MYNCLVASNVIREAEMRDLLFQYNPWWEQKYELRSIVDRPKFTIPLEKYIKNKSIILLTGLRRIGKTTLLKLLIKKLITAGTKPGNIFYVSLDDYLLEKKSIIEIISEYRKIHKLPVSHKIYLFLDEIAYKDNFQQQLKNIYDNQNAKIYATSSSSSLLKDKKAFLTGREFLIEIYPLDFEEYLSFRKIDIKQRDRKLQEPYFEDFMKSGGIPEYVLNSEREYIINLVDDIIYKDIISAHNIKSVQLVKDYFMLLMERSGKQASINKIAKILKISSETSKRYLKYFEDTHLIYLMPRYGTTNEKILSPKKVYATDLGLKNLFTNFRDIGSFFENYVYMKLRHKKPGYLYTNGVELDFITEDKILVEAKYNSEMTSKQQKLFSSYPAKKKILIDNIYKLRELDKL